MDYGILGNSPSNLNDRLDLLNLLKEANVKVDVGLSEAAILPTVAFRILNFAYFVVLTLCLARLLYKKKFLPNKKKSGVEPYFKLVLYTHGAFYASEILISDLWYSSVDSAAHHVASLVLFYCSCRELHVVSFVYVLPYWLHAAMWTINDFSPATMFSYNVALAGAIALIFHTSCKNRFQIISKTLMLAAFALLTVNYSVYCFSYGGRLCPPQLLPGYFASYIELLLQSIAIFYTLTVAFLKLGSYQLMGEKQE